MLACEKSVQYGCGCHILSPWVLGFELAGVRVILMWDLPSLIGQAESKIFGGENQNFRIPLSHTT